MADAPARALSAEQRARQYTLAHPCRHRDLEFGSRVPTRVGELSSEDCDDLYACIESWFQEHGAHLPRPDQPLFRVDPATGHIQNHVCDSGCPWLIHNTVYYCCWSGAFHNCTNEACEYTASAPVEPAPRRSKDHFPQAAAAAHSINSRACRITGLTFDLAFGLTFEQDGWQQPERRRAVNTAVPKPAVAGVSKWTRKHGVGGDALCLMSPSPEPSPSPSPPPPPAPRVRPLFPFQLTTTKSREEELLITAGYINHFVAPPLLDIDTCRVLAAEILDIGDVCAQVASANGWDFPLTYTPLAHVMTILTCMHDHAEHAHGRVFIPFHIELVGRLLRLDDRIFQTGKRNQSKQHTEWKSKLNSIKRAYCLLPPPLVTAPKHVPLPMQQLRPVKRPHEDRGRLLSAATLAALVQADSQQWPLLA